MSEEREVIWKVTKGTAEIEAEERAKLEQVRKIVDGLARCSVCGGRARVKVFGLEGNGVWVGCIRSPECSRYVELHTEGWSLEECAAEWNWYNTGWRKVLRKCKVWCMRRWGRVARAEKGWAKKVAEEKREVEERRREVFGVDEPKKGGWWRKIGGKMRKWVKKSSKR